VVGDAPRGLWRPPVPPDPVFDEQTEIADLAGGRREKAPRTTRKERDHIPAVAALREITRAWPWLPRTQHVSLLLLAFMSSDTLLPNNRLPDKPKRVHCDYWDGCKVNARASGFINHARRPRWQIGELRISTKHFAAWMGKPAVQPPRGIARRDFRSTDLPLVEAMHQLLSESPATLKARAARMVLVKTSGQVAGVSHRATVKRLVSRYTKWSNARRL
jgi:hypothetical protein